MRWISLLALIVAMISPAFSMGKKPDKATITFHVEAQKTDNPKMIFPAQAPGGPKYFNRLPAVRTKEVVAFKPFTAKDGSFGATFKLNKIATNRLAAVTMQNQQKWMIAVVNGRPTNVVFIDKPVRDGVMVVWSGIKHSEIDRYDYMFPRIGENAAQWKARKKLVKERLKKKKT